MYPVANVMQSPGCALLLMDKMCVAAHG